VKRYRYQAVITLYPPQRGGLRDSLPPQARCLVVRAHDPGTHRSKLFSSVVTADDGRPLRPGDHGRVVIMQVNGDDAHQYVHTGDHFDLWFGSEVGHGVVSRRMVTWP
jgi:hypothetical protein